MTQVGPRDRADVTDAEVSGTMDLGALLVTGFPGIQIQAQADQSTGNITALSLLAEGAAVQVQPYAAPKSGGMWAEVREQLASGIRQGGGSAQEMQGAYGTELLAEVINESGQRQPARFVGVEGPRWFIRGVFLGAAAQHSPAQELLEQAFNSLIVVRGDTAMPKGAALALRVPAQATEGASAPPPPNPFVRGPEITEIR